MHAASHWSHSATMPRKLSAHLHREINRDRTPVWYYRRGHGPRIRVPGEFGSVEFRAAYEAARKGKGRRARSKGPTHGTFAWAVEQYRVSQGWRALSLTTRRQRENILKGIVKALGETRLSQWKRGDVVAGRDKRSATPAAARHFVDTLRGLFTWALEARHVASVPQRA